MKDEEKLEFESIEDSGTIRKYLCALEQGFAKGCITLASEERVLVFETHDFLFFRITAKKKSGESKISIKLIWKEDESKKQTNSISIE